MTMRVSTGVRDGAASAFATEVDAGAGTSVLELRSGTPPTNLTDAAAGTLLASFDLPATSFGAPSTGTITANSIDATTGDDDGTVGHFRVVNGDGDAVEDSDSVGTSGTELVLNTLEISTGVDVEITSWTVTFPES